MRAALDTSVLVAALWSGHRRHGAARRWVLPTEDPEMERVICAHALAETWSVLTRLPIQPRVGPAPAVSMMEHLDAAVEVEPVDAGLQLDALRRAASRGLVGGAVHDALHLLAAERAGAEVLVTLNPRDFERLRVARSPRVVEPS